MQPVPPSRMPYVPGLTSLRGVAAAFVVIFHGAAIWLPEVARHTKLFTFAYVWVDLFFLLSGFVLGQTHGDDFAHFSRDTTRRFFQKRFARIMPMHLAVLAALVVFRLAARGPLGDFAPWTRLVYPHAPNWGELARTVFLVHAWGFESRGIWNLPSWSISVEWAVYLGFPLAAWALRRSAAPARWVVVVGGLGAIVLLSVTHGSIDLAFDGTGLLRGIPEFLVGLSLSYLVKGNAMARLATQCGRAGVHTAVLLVIGVCLHFGRFDAFIVWLFVPLLLGAYRGAPAVNAFWSLRPVHWFGEVSYSVYLLHVPAYAVARALLSPTGMSGLMRSAVCFGVIAVTVALAGLTYRFIESPARRWLQPARSPRQGAAS